MTARTRKKGATVRYAVLAGMAAATYLGVSACGDVPVNNFDGTLPDATHIIVGDGGIIVPPGAITLSGSVQRTVGLSSGNDGKGTLCVAISDRCPSLQHQNPMGYVGIQFNDTDLSSKSTSIDFIFDATHLEPGRYVISGYLSEAGGNCNGRPHRNDPVTFHASGSSPCAEFEYAGNSLEGLGMRLNFLMPF